MKLKSLLKTLSVLLLVAGFAVACEKDLTEEEQKAIPYVILANQFVCVAWFAEQDKYLEIFETNKKMTLWLIDRLDELKDI